MGVSLNNLFSGSASGEIANYQDQTGVSHGYARPNNYLVYIFPPPSGVLPKFGETEVGRLSINAMTASLPEFGLDIFENLVNAKTYHQPANATNAKEITITFYYSVDNREKLSIDSWISEIYRKDKGYLRYYDDIVGTVVVNLLNHDYENHLGYQGEVIYTITLNQAYPVTCGEITLDYAQVDTVMTFPVTFKFIGYTLTTYEGSIYYTEIAANTSGKVWTLDPGSGVPDGFYDSVVGQETFGT